MSKAHNEINNVDLKNLLADAALRVLKENAGGVTEARCEFEYLFGFENSGLMALFKMVTDKGTVFFSVNGKELMTLEITEQQFKNRAEAFLSLYGNIEPE